MAIFSFHASGHKFDRNFEGEYNQYDCILKNGKILSIFSDKDENRWMYCFDEDPHDNCPKHIQEACSAEEHAIKEAKLLGY